jgi:hypothetical protein
MQQHDCSQESAGIYPQQRLKKTLLVLSLLFLVGQENLVEAHAWVDSSNGNGYCWTIDTLNDSIQWRISEVNAKGLSPFPVGDTLVRWGKYKNPMPMRGTNPYYTINRITPYIKDSTYLFQGWKWVTQWRLAISGDTAVVFNIFTNNSSIISSFLFPIQGSVLLVPFSVVTNKVIHQSVTKLPLTGQRFLLNGRQVPHAQHLHNRAFQNNLIN